MGNSSQEDTVSKQINKNQQSEPKASNFFQFYFHINSAFKSQGNQYRQTKQSVSLNVGSHRVL